MHPTAPTLHHTTQDWLEAPDYPGKSEADIQAFSVTSLSDAMARLGSSVTVA